MIATKERIEIVEKLSAPERQEFRNLLKVVRTGMESFMDAGKALYAIREKRLYREKFSNFEDFCREQFSWTRMHAGRIISAYSVVQRLKDKGIEEVPKSEWVARELTNVPEAKREDVWNRALEIAGEKKPDARIVREAVVEVLPPTDKLRVGELDLLAKLRSAERNMNAAHEISGQVTDSPEATRMALDLLASISSVARVIKTELRPKESE